MKTDQHQRLTKLKMPGLLRLGFLSFLFFSLLLNVGCDSRIEREYKKAREEAALKNYPAALEMFENILKEEPTEALALTSAREASRIAYFENKDFLRAIKFYQHLVFYSQDPEEVLQSQRQIVQIYLEHLSDYEKAIVELGKLIPIEMDPKVRVDLRIKLARAHYHMKRFFQALAEIDEALKTKEGQEQEFEILLLKANVLTADKKYGEAVAIFKGLMAKDRKLAIKENVPLALAACYEEMKEFGLALELLQSIQAEHPVPEYVDLRIKRLNERVKNQPKTKTRPPAPKKK